MGNGIRVYNFCYDLWILNSLSGLFFSLYFKIKYILGMNYFYGKMEQLIKLPVLRRILI